MSETIKRPDFQDFKKEDGSYDYRAYEKAQVDLGFSCYRCGHYLIWGGKGYQELCSGCKSMDKDKDREIVHDSMIRCPVCGHQQEMNSDYEEACYSDGDHTVPCNNCEFEYEISTYVSCSYRSPEMVTHYKTVEECVAAGQHGKYHQRYESSGCALCGFYNDCTSSEED